MPSTSSPGSKQKSEKTLTSEEKHDQKLSFFYLLYLYLKPAGLFVMSLVVFLVVLFGTSRTIIGVYLQYWMDAGDGLMVSDLLVIG